MCLDSTTQSQKQGPAQRNHAFSLTERGTQGVGPCLIAHFCESCGFTRPPMTRIQVCRYPSHLAAVGPTILEVYIEYVFNVADVLRGLRSSDRDGRDDTRT